jgi:hypothetical protein
LTARKAIMDLSPNLCRAARSLLGWKPDDLARACDLAVQTIKRLEAGGSVGQFTRAAVMEALEAAGVEFIPDGGSSLFGGAGVRRRPGPIEEPEVAVAKVSIELEPNIAAVNGAKDRKTEAKTKARKM